MVVSRFNKNVKPPGLGDDGQLGPISDPRAEGLVSPAARRAPVDLARDLSVRRPLCLVVGVCEVTGETDKSARIDLHVKSTAVELDIETLTG